MAENKYITQIQEHGTIHISEDVVFSIVGVAAAEVEGVAGIATKIGADIAERVVGKNWGKGVKLEVEEDESLKISCNINVAYGQSVLAVAAAVQEAVSSAVESMTGLKVSQVDVNICGIV